MQIVKLNFLIQRSNNYLTRACKLEKVHDVASLNLVTQYVGFCVIDHYIVAMLSYKAKQWLSLVNLLLFYGDYWVSNINVLIW